MAHWRGGKSGSHVRGWREKKKERVGWIRRNGWWCGPV